jgi:hypothetical protein
MELTKATAAWDSVNKDVLLSSAKVIEMTIFAECFGEEFRERLMDDIIEYSYKKYSDADVYSEGDIVEHNFVLYRSLKEENDCFVTFVDDWEKVPKFEKEIYNQLWSSGMESWISNTILSTNLGALTYPISGKGVTKQFEDSGQRTVDVREFYTVKKDIENVAKMSHRIMVSFVDKHRKELGFAESNCGETGCETIENDRIAW